MSLDFIGLPGSVLSEGLLVLIFSLIVHEKIHNIIC